MVHHLASGTQHAHRNRSTEDECLHKEQLIRRLRCKAEACRVAVLESNADTRDPVRRRRCEEVGKTLTLDLWMLRPHVVHGGATQELAMLADCTDETASAVETLTNASRAATVTPQIRRAVLSILAEAQSMMRVATHAVHKKIPGARVAVDADQIEAHNVLTTTAKRNHVCLPRYGRLNDPAKPEDVHHLREELREIAAVIANDRSRRS